MEMTLENLLSEGQLNHADFLARVDILGSLGRTVLDLEVRRILPARRLSLPLHKQMVALVMGVPSLHEIFDEKYYLNLEGGILEALGRMFKSGLKLFVYPMEDEKTRRADHRPAARGRAESAASLPILARQRLHPGDPEVSSRVSENFPARCARENASGDPSWESMVPPEVAQIIKAREFFGFRRTAA